MTIAAFAPVNALARNNVQSSAAISPASTRTPAFISNSGAAPSRMNHIVSAQGNGGLEPDGNGNKPNRPLVRIPLEKIQSLREHVMDSVGPKLGAIQDGLSEKRGRIESEIGKWEGAARETVSRAEHALDPVKDVANESIDSLKENLPKSDKLAKDSAKNLEQGQFGKAYGAFLGAAGARLLEGVLKDLGTKKPDQSEPVDGPDLEDATDTTPVKDDAVDSKKLD